MEIVMAHTDSEIDETLIAPPPGDESQAEHDRIRKSNDIDQTLEREGVVSTHNRGYDEAAEGRQPTITPAD
jgi:hypothetical protein